MFSINSKSDARKKEVLKHFSDVHKEQFQNSTLSEKNGFFAWCQCTASLTNFLILPIAFTPHEKLLLKLKDSILKNLPERGIYEETRYLIKNSYWTENCIHIKSLYGHMHNLVADKLKDSGLKNFIVCQKWREWQRITICYKNYYKNRDQSAVL